MSESFRTRNRKDVAAVVQADVEGRTIDSAERAETLLLTGYDEADVREIVDSVRDKQRQAEVAQAIIDTRDATRMIAKLLAELVASQNSGP